MPTIQEALTDALEHPLTEPRAKPTRRRREIHRAGEDGLSASSSALLWGVLGSFAGVLLIITLYKRSHR